MAVTEGNIRSLWEPDQQIRFAIHCLRSVFAELPDDAANGLSLAEYYLYDGKEFTTNYRIFRTVSTAYHQFPIESPIQEAYSAVRWLLWACIYTIRGDHIRDSYNSIISRNIYDAVMLAARVGRSYDQEFWADKHNASILQAREESFQRMYMEFRRPHYIHELHQDVRDNATGILAEAVRIAKTIQDGDLGAIPILADALEDLGLRQEYIDHLRTEKEHSRGCWVARLLAGPPAHIPKVHSLARPRKPKKF